MAMASILGGIFSMTSVFLLCNDKSKSEETGQTHCSYSSWFGPHGGFIYLSGS